MKAAVIEDPSQPPKYTDFDDPKAEGDKVIIDVTAAALTPTVKSRAGGKHYASRSGQKFVPGVDGVGYVVEHGKRTDRRVFFLMPEHPFGSLAEHSLVQRSSCIDIPDELDDVTAAALGNPGMSSWAALTEKARIQPGEAVLINGATGAAGHLAIQIAKHLGAGKVVVTGRNAEKLRGVQQLGADATIPLDLPKDGLKDAFVGAFREARVSIVLDYLWGEAAETIFDAIGEQKNVSSSIRYVEIGALAGPKAAIPSSTLRSVPVRLDGSGNGSISHETYVRVLHALMQAAVPAKLKVGARRESLERVEGVWQQKTHNRIVFEI